VCLAFIRNSTERMIRTLCLSIAWISLAHSWESCAIEDGGGICPTGNKCCRTAVQGISSCIAEPVHKYNGTAMCCPDNTTGCAPGYECATITSNELDDAADRYFCRLNAPPSDDPAPPTLPRYKNCVLVNESLQIHGLQISPTGLKLAYFSSLGALDDDSKIQKQRRTTHAFIDIHGSGRNAEDYFCSATASLPSGLVHTTLVIAPWFMSPQDEAPDTSHTFLQWNETGPIPHTWRYGAEATDGVTSSYQALDIMVEAIMFDDNRFPNLRQIIVAGHSAGGQFTHRWALTSSATFWEDSRSGSGNRIVPVRVVAANPRSFCYLDDRRYGHNRQLVKPERRRIAKCPGYNGWEWGLATKDGRVPLPRHIQKSIEDHDGDVTWLIQSYSVRDVVYLAGSLDILSVRSECEDDDFQGKNRFERSRLYFNSLQEIYGSSTHHRRLVADGIPHDHTLIFQSKAGQDALFGNLWTRGGVSVQTLQDGQSDH
jgi:hypothetical protein